MKQTAVEWLIEAIESQKITIVYSDKILSVSVPLAIAEQAKQMEKEQLEEAWNDGNLLGRNGNVILEYTTGKEYYKETYKQ